MNESISHCVRGLWGESVATMTCTWLASNQIRVLRVFRVQPYVAQRFAWTNDPDKTTLLKLPE